MLSILIPIYNYDAKSLAESLLQQCETLPIKYEIIFADDCSTNKEISKRNKDFFLATDINYIEVEHNMGRSKIRNLLAKKTKGDFLLFLDCDSGIVKKDFLYKYLQFGQKYDVVCGGTIYCNKKHISKEKLLHWTCGKQREEGKKHFTTNNFLIKKEVFERIEFNEKIKGYGHEDTLLGEELKQNGYKICYIDNPVEHLGIKSTDKFIFDTISASKNLALLYKQELYKSFLENVTLVKAYKKLEKLHCTEIFSLCFVVIKQIIILNLHSKHPNIKCLDMLKLYTFIKQYKENYLQ